jgi:hypothetical protein
LQAQPKKLDSRRFPNDEPRKTGAEMEFHDFRLLPSQKVTFVRQATVRPDLPPPPASAGVGCRVE